MELKVKNALEFAEQEKDRIGYKGNCTVVHFAGPQRMFVRKAQYHCGWDWGSAINISGSWKSLRQEVSKVLSKAVVRLKGSLSQLRSQIQKRSRLIIKISAWTQKARVQRRYRSSGFTALVTLYLQISTTLYHH